MGKMKKLILICVILAVASGAYADDNINVSGNLFGSWSSDYPTGSVQTLSNGVVRVMATGLNGYNELTISTGSLEENKHYRLSVSESQNTVNLISPVMELQDSTGKVIAAQVLSNNKYDNVFKSDGAAVTLYVFTDATGSTENVDFQVAASLNEIMDPWLKYIGLVYLLLGMLAACAIIWGIGTVNS